MEATQLPTPDQLEGLMLKILQGQNIQEVEAFFKHYLRNIQSVVDLMHQLVHNENLGIRQLSSVLLRKKITKHWPNLSPDTQANIKSILIERLVNESQGAVRKNIANLVAKIASVAIMHWPELLQFIEQLIGGSSDAQEIGLYLLAEMLDIQQVNEFLAPHSQSLMSLFQNALTSQALNPVKRYALKGLSNLINTTEQPELVDSVVGLLPNILVLLENSIAEYDTELIVAGITVLDNLLDSGAEIGDQLDLAAKLVMEKVAINKDMELNIRECAMSFLELITETKHSTLSKKPDMVNWLIYNTFLIASEQDDQPKEHTPVDMAFRFLDALAINLPNKAVYRPIVEMTQQLRNDQNHCARKASLIALGVIAEGCQDSMKQELTAVITTIVSGFSDSHQSVREGAGLALGYCSEHLKPDILEHHALILPPLIQLIPSAPTQVKTKALFAIDTFCEYFDEDIEPYLSTLIPTLVNLVMNDEPKIRQLAISAMTQAVSSAEKKISPYYADMIQLLGNVIQNAGTDNPLKATALQCLGQLAAASNLQAFSPYLQESVQVANEFINTDVLELREASFTFFYLLSRVMQEGIEPFVDNVINQAIYSITSSDKVTVQITDDPDSDSDDEQMPQSIRTVFLDEKTSAIHTVGQFCLSCPNKMLQYIEKIMDTLEQVHDYQHHNVRQQVVTTYQQIIEGLTKGNPGFLPENAKLLWYSYILPKYINRLQQETSKEVVCRVLEAFEELAPHVGPDLLNQEWMEGLVTKLEILLNEAAVCQRKEQEELDEDKDHDESLMTDLCDLLQVLAKVWGDSLSWAFERLMIPMQKYTRVERNLRDRNIVIGCLADCILYLPSLVAKHYEAMSQLVFLNLNQGDPSLYRNTIYFLGILCSKAGELLAGKFLQYLQALEPFFVSQDVDQATVDNAVAAVAHMIMASPQSVPLQQALPVIFSKLPLKEDLEEVGTVIRCLIFMMGNNIDITGWLELVIEILFDGVIQSRIEPDKYKLDIHLLGQVKQVLMGLKERQEFVNVGQRLSSEQQAIVTEALSSQNQEYFI